MTEQNTPIRILRIINRFNIGGPTFNVAYLTKYMDSRFETKLIGGIKDDSEASSEFILDSLDIKREHVSTMERSISPSNDRRALAEIKAIIRDYDPHIVHTHAAKSGTLGRLAAIQLGVPIILHTFHGHVFHSYFGSLKTQIFKLIERYLASKSTRIIAISKQQKHELGTIHRIAPSSKIEIVPLGFDLSKFREDRDRKREVFRSEYGLQDDEVAIGIIGRLVPIKNHDMFIQSINHVLKNQPKARFFIVGDGESAEELKNTCAEHNVSYVWKAVVDEQHPLCFTSWRTDVDVVMAGLDIVALTSLNEGTPVSLIEAQSAGKPVISTKVGGVEDIAVENESAFLVNTSDQPGFNEKLSELASDEALRTKMGTLGEGFVEKRCSYTRLVHDMEELYMRLLREKKLID